MESFERVYDSSDEEREFNHTDPCRVSLCLDFAILVRLFGPRKVATCCQHIINAISRCAANNKAGNRLIQESKTPEPSIYKTNDSITAVKIAILISTEVSKMNKNRSFPIPIMGIFCQKEAEEVFDINLINSNLRKGIEDINIFITSRIHSDISSQFSEEYNFRHAKISTGNLTIEGYYIEPLHYEMKSVAIGKTIIYHGPYTLCLSHPNDVTCYRRTIIGHLEKYISGDNNPTTIWRDPKTALMLNLEKKSNKFVLTIGYGITFNTENNLIISDAYLALSNMFQELSISNSRALITNEIYERLNPEDFPDYNIVPYHKQDHCYFYGSIVYAVLEKNIVAPIPQNFDLLQLT